MIYFEEEEWTFQDIEDYSNRKTSILIRNNKTQIQIKKLKNLIKGIKNKKLKN